MLVSMPLRDILADETDYFPAGCYLDCSAFLRCDESGVIHSTLGIDTQPPRLAPSGELNDVECHADGSFSIAAHLLFGALRLDVPSGISPKQLVRVRHEGCDSLIAGFLVPRQANDLDVLSV